MMRPFKKWLADDLSGIVRVIGDTVKELLNKIREGVNWIERKLDNGVTSIDEDLTRWINE